MIIKKHKFYNNEQNVRGDFQNESRLIAYFTLRWFNIVTESALYFIEAKESKMHIDGLDEFDNKIISELEKNARLSYSEIGEKVGLSRVSVKNRMDILEEKGIIRGYVALINPTGFPEGRRFFMDIITEPDRFEEVVDNIAKYDIIRKVYAVTGESRFKAEGYASSNMKYEMFMKSVRQSMNGVRSCTIQDVQYTIKDVDGGAYYVRLDERTE